MFFCSGALQEASCDDTDQNSTAWKEGYQQKKQNLIESREFKGLSNF